jgi:hypothetical protein
MKRVILHLFFIAAFAGLSALPMTATAGEILRATPASDFKWRTTECRKPIQNTSPSISRQQSLERYAQDITRYLACLQREAQRDLDKAQMQMQTAIEAELDAETKRMDAKIKRAYRATR